jgi:HTH-type transcriptional regulator/antitoxin HipB
MQERIASSTDIGRLVRQKRKADGLTLAEAAALCNVGYRFFSNIENGKPTAQIGKVLQVLTGLGLEIGIGPRGW